MAAIGAPVTGPIAHVGPDMPLALLEASGRHAGSLAFDPDAPTPAADQWMESKFAPFAKSILEAWAAGAYDDCVQVVFSRTDDSAQRLYYYLCELQRRGLVGGPEPLILDIAKIRRPSSLARTEACLRQLAERLAVSEAMLAEALEGTRGDRPAGPVSETVDDPVCLLTGTPPPDRRLHATVAQAGFAPVGRTLHDTWDEAVPTPREGSEDPFAALARQLHGAEEGSRSFADPAAVLRRSLERSNARAVILWQIEEDEAQAWHLPAQRRALAEAGVPSLVLTRRDWLARDGVREEIAGFLQEIAR